MLVFGELSQLIKLNLPTSFGVVLEPIGLNLEKRVDKFEQQIQMFFCLLISFCMSVVLEFLTIMKDRFWRIVKDQLCCIHRLSGIVLDDFSQSTLDKP